MNKDDVVLAYTHTYTGILPSHQKWNLAIWDNTDGPRGYYAEWKKLEKETEKSRYCTISLICRIFKKWTTVTKQKQSYQYREQTGICQRGENSSELLRGTNPTANKWVRVWKEQCGEHSQ